MLDVPTTPEGVTCLPLSGTTFFETPPPPRTYVLDTRGTQVHNALHLTSATSGRTAWEGWRAR